MRKRTYWGGGLCKININSPSSIIGIQEIIFKAEKKNQNNSVPLLFKDKEVNTRRKTKRVENGCFWREGIRNGGLGLL